MSQAQQLELQTRAFSFGQDTSKLYARVGDDEGKKRWRVEFAATENEKEEAAMAILEFKETFPLQKLKLSKIYEEHVAHLERLVAEGAPQHRPWYARRLASTRESQKLLDAIPIVYNDCWAFDGLCDFVTYVHGKEHGTREKLRVPKPRAKPYGIGRVAGAILCTRTPSCFVLTA